MDGCVALVEHTTNGTKHTNAKPQASIRLHYDDQIMLIGTETDNYTDLEFIVSNSYSILSE